MADVQKYYYRDITNALGKGKIEPAYFIYGEENYLIDNVIDQLKSKFVGEAQKEINYFLRYAQDASIDDLLALAAGGGLFSARKLIVYKDFQNLRNPTLDRLKIYLKNPDTEICLCIIARTTTLSGARYRQLQGMMRTVQITALRETELGTLIKKEFESYGKTVTTETVQALFFLVGDQIQHLKTEVLQVSNYFKDKTAITPEDIETVVGAYANQNVFELTRSIAQKKIDEALYILHNLLEKGENPGTVLFFLLRHLMILWKIRGFHRSGIKSPKMIQDKLKLYPRHFAEYIKELPQWTSRQLNEAIQCIHQSDQALKSSQMSPSIVLDTLVLKLINLK